MKQPSERGQVHALTRKNNFDLIRLLAASQVVCVHAIGHTPVLEAYPPWLRQVMDWVVLFPGVAVFFVISGFLIPQSYERLAGRPGTYFMHRALRIYPALWVCLVVSLGLLAAFGFLGGDVLGSGSFWGWLLGQSTIGQFYNPECFRGFGVGVVNGALWTITVELQFYVAVPLWVWLRRRAASLAGWLLLASFLVSFVIFCYVDIESNRAGGFHEAPLVAKLLSVSLVPHWWMFVLGMVLQRRFGEWRGWFEGRFLAHFAAYTTVAAIRQLVIGRDASWLGLYYPGYLPERVLLATMTVAAAFSARGLSQRLLRGVDISYGVYIYHFLIINTLLQAGSMTTLESAVWVLAVAGVAGAASWYGVEKRALAFKPRVDSPP